MIYNPRDVVIYDEPFFGYLMPQTAGATVDGRWCKKDTSSAGSPTVGSVTGAKGIALTLAADEEAEVLTLYHGDLLQFLITRLLKVRFRAKITASLNAAVTAILGMASAQSDTIDSIAQQASFRVLGSNAVYCETDDGTTDRDDIATGDTLAATLKWFEIDFAQGLSNVQFFMEDANAQLQRVGRSTVFDMSAYSGALQPFFQLQKTSATAVATLHIDHFQAILRAR